MSKEIRLFKSEEPKTRAEVVEFLHNLAEKLAGGNVSFSQGQQEIALTLPQRIILEVQIEDEDKGSKGIQHSLEIELKWFDNDDSVGTMEMK